MSKNKRVMPGDTCSLCLILNIVSTLCRYVRLVEDLKNNEENIEHEPQF